MFGKAVLLVVFAAVAVQSYVPHDVKEHPTKDTDAKSLHHLKEIIEKSVKVEKEALHKLHKELSEKIREAIHHDKAKFHKQVHESFEKIKKLEEEARKHKVDIKACLKDQQELKHLSKEFHKKVAVCDKDISTKSKAVVDKEKKAVEESLHIVKKLTAELKACKKNADSLKCKAKVAAEITRADKQEPAKIKKTVEKAVPAILHLVPTVEKCLSKEAHTLIAKGEKIAKEIETCISKKIHLHLEA